MGRLIKTRRLTIGSKVAVVVLHTNKVPSKIQAIWRRLGLKQECTMRSFGYGEETQDIVSDTQLLEGVKHRDWWRSKRTMSLYGRPAEYMQNTQKPAMQQRELAEKVLAIPNEYFNVAPPQVREYDGDETLFAKKLEWLCSHTPGTYVHAIAKKVSWVFLAESETCRKCSSTLALLTKVASP